MKRFISALLALALATALFGTPARADSDQAKTRPDTKLGNYDEAPYRDIVVNWGRDGLNRRTVEIPWEYVFSPQHLDRKVVINGREWRDLVVVSRMWEQTGEGEGMRYYVHDLFEVQGLDVQRFLKTLNANWAQSQFSAEEIERIIQGAYNRMVTGDLETRIMGNYDYPLRETIVSINGRPWQETEWRDFIIEQSKKLLEPSDPILAEPRLWEAFLNPAYNGRARELLAGDTSQTAPAQPPATVATPPDQVILTLGSTEVIRYRAGAVETVTLDVPVTAEDGITMVPLRGILDHFGAQLTYWSDSVTVTDGPNVVILRIGTPTAMVNDREVALPRPPLIENGRTLVPLRFLAEALGYTVTWDPATSQITISK